MLKVSMKEMILRLEQKEGLPFRKRILEKY